jgi:hypothetical protein
MDGRHGITGLARLGAAAVVAALGLGAVVVAPAPASARVFVGVGVGFPGYYYPGPYGYYPPAYYPPPPSYYYPPAPAYYPPAAPNYYPPAAPAPAISYTNQPPFYNSAGEQCRRYTSTQYADGRSSSVYGTACRGADGQWRVAN